MKEYRKLYFSGLMKKRTYAFTIDLLFICLLNKVMINSYTLYLQTVFYHFPAEKQLELLSSLENVFLGLFSVLFVSYFTLSFYLGKGQTPGKLLFSIQVVNHRSDRPISFIQSIVRALGQGASCLLFFTPFIFSFIFPQWRGLHEWMSSTKIIHINPQRAVAPVEDLPEEEPNDYSQAA